MFHWNQVIGIFGGSFDPPHAGHLAAAEGVLRLPGLKKVWILPSGNPPWKKVASSAQCRLEMSKLAFSNLPEVEVQGWELELASRAPEQSTTTWRLLDFIRPKTSGAELAWIIGGDQLLALDKWERFPELLGRCHWVILLRKGEKHSESPVFRKLLEFEARGLTQPVPGSNAWMVAEDLSRGKPIRIEVFPTEAPELSSTQIREEAARSGSVQKAQENGWITPVVAQYLKEKKLYGTGNHDL